MATVKTDHASLIARYASTFHEVIGGGHHVASPLGAWLLLALCAPAARGAEADALAEVLGGSADEVAAVAAEMLAAPHPLVAAVAAVWGRPSAAGEGWLASLPSPVARGEVIPEQRDLDRWARDHTFGLIEKFPIEVDPLVYLLLATALATKVSWDRPFDLAPGTALGESSPWAKDLRHVLKSPNHPAHSAFATTSPRAGDVAVHIGHARGGLLVASVIASAEVARADVLAAAHAIAIAFARGEALPRRRLSDLPQGDAPLWSVRDERSAREFGARCVAVLPAWSAADKYHLSNPRLGFEAAAKALGGADPWEASQAATANYSRTGFEAAAVTAMAVRMAMMPRGGVLRTVELRFGHPYAVVAVTAAADASHAGGQAGVARPTGQARSGKPGPWHAVPVFSAWVTKPHSAKTDS